MSGVKRWVMLDQPAEMVERFEGCNDTEMYVLATDHDRIHQQDREEIERLRCVGQKLIHVIEGHNCEANQVWLEEQRAALAKTPDTEETNTPPPEEMKE